MQTIILIINGHTKFKDQSIKATNKVEGNYRFLAIFTIFKQFGRGCTCATFKNVNNKLFYYIIKPITNIKKLHSLSMLQISRYEAHQYGVLKKVILVIGLTLIKFLSMFPLS